MCNLFFNCLRAILRDAPVEKKLQVAIEIMDDISSLSWKETVVYSYRKSSDFIIFSGYFTWIVGRILMELDPTLNIRMEGKRDFYLYQNLASHPYLVRIIKRLGRLAIPEGWEYHLEERLVKLDVTTSPREVYEKYVERSEFLISLKREEEVDRIIDKVLQEEGIQII